MMKPKNFNEATAVVSTINYLWGLRICQQPKNKVRFFINWIYCISILSVSVAIILFSEVYQLQKYITQTQSKMSSHDEQNTMYLYLIGFYAIVITWIVILGWYHSKGFLVFTKQISEIDEKFEKLGSPFNYQSMFIRILISGSVWLFSSLIFYGIYLKSMLEIYPAITILITTFSYLYGNNVGSIVLFDFKTSVFWLGIRFKHTNELLSSIFVKDHRIERDIDSISKSTQNHQFEYFPSRSKIFPKNRTSDFKYEPGSTKMMFEQIRMLHLELCCTAKRLSNLFDFQLLLYTVHSLMHLAMSSYYICMDIRNSKGSFKPIFSVVTIMIMDRLVNFTKFYIVSYNCEHAMKQACKMVEIVHEFSLYETDVELREEILQFLLQLSHTNLGKSKTNFFRINFSFLRECVSFVATYLIIVIQFNLNLDTFDDLVTQNSTIH